MQERILALVRSQGVVRPREVEALGIAREYLLRLTRQGSIVREGRGVYRLADAPISEHHTLAEVAKRIPKGTICLLSALAFHEMSLQIPHEVWIALPPGTRDPRGQTVKLRVFRFSGHGLTEGRQEHCVEGVRVWVYSPAKTIVDCFRFRNRIGLEVALEALRRGLREKKASITEVRKYAAMCRAQRVMQPYLDALA